MERAAAYRKRAEEAERLAGRAATEVERAAYRRIADGWRDLEAAALKARKPGD